jgi:hypothetical protein
MPVPVELLRFFDRAAPAGSSATPASAAASPPAAAERDESELPPVPQLPPVPEIMPVSELPVLTAPARQPADVPVAAPINNNGKPPATT